MVLYKREGCRKQIAVVCGRQFLFYMKSSGEGDEKMCVKFDALRGMLSSKLPGGGISRSFIIYYVLFHHGFWARDGPNEQPGWIFCALFREK